MNPVTCGKAASSVRGNTDRQTQSTLCERLLILSCSPKQEMLAMADRLDVLADAVTKCNWSEFTMRVPAEVDRDADIVMSNAAKCLREYAAARGDGAPNELKELFDEMEACWVEACWICASLGEGEITLETINNWSGRISVLTAALAGVAGLLRGVSVPGGYALVPLCSPQPLEINREP